MRTLLITFILSVALGISGLAGAASTTRKPVLRLVGNDVQGRSFHRREVVRLRFSGQFELMRRVRTSAIGAFSAALPKTYDPCSGPLVITASSLRGDDAVLKLPQRACPPPA